jgi:hypothetical protein
MSFLDSPKFVFYATLVIAAVGLCAQLGIQP